MSTYKEIVTKTVIGKGKKYFKNKYSIELDETPSTILGCWIINNKFNGLMNGDNAVVSGSYDVNIWYSLDNNTKTNVVNKTINYNEDINIKSKIDADYDEADIIVKTIKQPECTNATITGNTINFDIEKEIGIEVASDEKIKILTEDEEDDWQDLNDKLDDETNDAIDREIQENFIN